MKLHGEPLEPRVKAYQDGFCKIHVLRPKGLNQVKLRSKQVTNRRTRAQLNLRSTVGLESNKSVQHRPEPSQSKAGQPRRGRPAPNCHRWSYATSTDSERRSRTSTQRRWPRGHIPWPAGPTWQLLLLSLGVEDKLNELTCVQLTLSPLPTSE